MRTTRIDVEGQMGRATIRRDGERIRIAGTRVTKVIEKKNGDAVLVGEAFELIGRAANHGANVAVAKMLQKYLDGYRGTGGDVADYLRAIETFED